MKAWHLVLALALGAGLSGSLGAQDSGGLKLDVKDLRIEQSTEGGYYLYIRKKPGISSVLLVESSKDPAMKLANYAYRNPRYHPENGDEKRILDGKFLATKDNWALIDSTPVDDPALGQAFRIFIPWVLVYGYPYTRYGEVQVMDGTWLGIRAFSKPYADYSGTFLDNPFVIQVTQKPDPVPKDAVYMEETVKAFDALAKDTQGKTWYSRGEADILKPVDAILDSLSGRDIEVVLVLDATNSMSNDADALRATLVPLLRRHQARHSTMQVGVVQYRDYLEEFLYRTQPETTDLDRIQATLDRYRPSGGRDIPEAVNEALWAALQEYPWGADDKVIILVGDAPPHPIPRGSVTPAMVEEKARETGVRIHSIILPH